MAQNALNYFAKSLITFLILAKNANIHLESSRSTRHFKQKWGKIGAMTPEDKYFS